MVVYSTTAQELAPTPSAPCVFVVFTLDEQRYALRLEAVERAVRAVGVTPLPKAPNIVLGIVNVQGSIMPVVSLRRRFQYTDREIEPEDQFVIAATSKRRLALVVDAVETVIQLSEEEVTQAESILSNLDYIEGVVKLQDGLVLIHDLARLLSLEEEEALERVLAEESP